MVIYVKVRNDRIYFMCLEGEKQISVASREREYVVICIIFCQIQGKKVNYPMG